MVKEMLESNSMFSLLRGIKNLVGVGMHLLLLGLLIEGLTLVVRQWISFPISLTFETQILLTVPFVAACLLGAIWFNRSLNLIRVHLLNRKIKLIIDGPFAYVRHPLYSSDDNPSISNSLAFGSLVLHPMGPNTCRLPLCSSSRGARID